MSFESENYRQIEQFNVESPTDYNRESINSEGGDADETNNNILYQNDENIVNNLNTSDTPLDTTFFGIKSNSELSCILNITVSSVGGGCFAFPYIIDSLGLINSFIIFLFVTICIYYSLDLLRCFVVDTKYFSYALITETILGKLWSKIYCVTSFLYYLSFVLNYLTLTYSYFQKMVKNSDIDLDLLGAIFLVLTCILEIFLCIFTSKTAKMHLLSMISLSTFLIILLSIITESFYTFFLSTNELKKFSSDKMFAVLSKKTVFSWFSANITYIYGYSYHCSFPTLMGNLKNVNANNTKTVHIWSFALITVSYLIVGILGYCIYDNVPEVLFDYTNTSETKEEDEDILFADKIFFQIILCLFLLSLIPSRYVTVRDNYTSFIGKKKLTSMKDLIITSILLILCNAVVFITKKSTKNEIGEFVSSQVNIFTSFVELFGGLFGVFTCFLLPAINYAAVNGIKKLRSYLGYIISGIFFLIGLIAAGYSIFKIIENKGKE